MNHANGSARRPWVTSLRGRLLMVLLGLTALPTLLIGGLAYRNARQTIETRVRARLNSVADLKKDQIGNWLDDRVSDVRLLADNFLNEEHFTVILDPSADPDRRKAFAGFLTDNIISMKEARRGYVEILFVDSKGSVILSTNSDRVGANLSAYGAVNKTLASPTGEFIDDIRLSGESNNVEMAFGHVLHAVDLATNQVLPEANGAVIIRVSMEQTIYPLIGEWPDRGETGETLLLRQDGDDTLFLNPLRFNADAAFKFSVPTDSPNAKPALLASRGLEGIIETPDYRGVPVLAAYRSIPGIGWGLVVKQDVAEAFAPVNSLTSQLAIATALVLATAGGTAVLLSRALTRPLTRLVTAARSVAAGNYPAQIAVDRADEVGALADSFRTMLTAVRQSHADLQTRSEELQALFDLSKTLLATIDLDVTLESALQQAIAGTNAMAGAVLLRSGARDEITIRAVVGLPQNIIGQSFPIDAHTAPGFALVRREPIFTNDIAQETRFHIPSFIYDLGVRANLAVPMLIGEDAIGALVVDSFTPRQFTANEIRVAQAIANQTAVALERARLFNDLSDSYDRTLDALAAALDARDKETEGHSRRVVAYTVALAREMSVPEDELAAIRRGALLHDIGKIGVPDAILCKPGPLTPEERETMNCHPQWGQRILAGIPFLQAASEIVYSHQEMWNGRGYPRGLKGEAIPLGARIFAVADTFDAITSDRPYRAARPYSAARAEIEKNSGAQFEPRVVDAFLRIPEQEWERLRAGVSTTTGAAGLLTSWAEPTPFTSSAELEAVNRLIMAVGGSLHLDEIVHQALDATVEILGAAAGGLFLYDEATDMLSLCADYGLPEAIKSRFAVFPVKGFHNEAVVREVCTRLHSDLSEIPAFAELGLPQRRPDLGAYLCLPITAKGAVHGIIGLFNRRPRPFDEKENGLYHAIGEQIGLAISNARLHESVQRMAITDSLTGAYNRRYLNEFLTQELQRCARYQHGVSLMLLDMDRFKQYNDSYGHPAGDEALRQVVSVLRRNVRAADLVARYGGEEFAVALPETLPNGAPAAAEKLRAEIAAHEFPYRRLTVSVGAAFCTPDADMTPEPLIAMADQALYQAKRCGGNRVSLWNPELAALPRQTSLEIKS